MIGNVSVIFFMPNSNFYINYKTFCLNCEYFVLYIYKHLAILINNSFLFFSPRTYFFVIIINKLIISQITTLFNSIN